MRVLKTFTYSTSLYIETKTFSPYLRSSSVFHRIALCTHRDLYPSLVNLLQSVPRVLGASDPLLPLTLQWILAVVSLLTQVTNTGGCHQELHTSVVRYSRRVVLWQASSAGSVRLLV